MTTGVVFIVTVVAVAAGAAVFAAFGAYYYFKSKNLKAVSEARSRMDSVGDMSADDTSKRMRDGNF